MILVKKIQLTNSKFNKLFTKAKEIKPMVWVLILLSLIASVLYFKILTKGEMTFEEEMLHNSKYVDAPIVKIDIKFNDYQNLLYQRMQALKDGGWYYKHNDHYEFKKVSAKITYKGNTFKSKIRLKGSRKVHFRDSTKMSFKIELKDDNTIMGMNKFAIHDPKQRNYIYEWMFHDFLKKEGFIALHYSFIHLFLNGADLGIYAVEENLDKRLVERYGYKDGPIFKLSDDSDVAFNLTTKAFNEKKYENTKFSKMTLKAKDLLVGLLDRKYNIRDVLNIEKVAKYYAACDFFDIYHGGLIKSIRLYYNPITMKFEPIGFDGHFDPMNLSISSEIPQKLGVFNNIHFMVPQWHELLFLDSKTTDELFWTEYIKTLKKYSSIKFVDDYFFNIADELTKNMAIIYKNAPLYYDHMAWYDKEKLFAFSKKYLLLQNAYIRGLLNAKSDKNLILFDGYYDNFNQNKRDFVINFSNNYPLPVKFKNLTINDSLLLYPKDDYFALPYKHFVVRGYKKYYFETNKSIPTIINSALLNFYIPGVDSTLTIEIPINKFDFLKHKNDLVRKSSNLKNYDKYLKLKGKELIFSKGKILITNNIKIEKGYKVIINEGTEIVFQDSGLLMSYSPVFIHGTKSNPINISSDGTGGIVVLNSVDTCRINNAIFNNLSFPRENEWRLTGALTFYESPVIMNNVVLKNNSSEDALNIIRSYFNLVNIHFINTSSDAFDADFSKGIIRNSSFFNSGNDAIDVSGSDIYCENILIDKSGDKAISAGEGSNIIIRNVEIKNCEIGITSKDLSEITADNISIINTKLGLTAYQKKTEYGSGKIVVNNISMERVEKEHIIESGSILKLNGKKIETTLEKVSDMLYGNEYGKKSIR